MRHSIDEIHRLLRLLDKQKARDLESETLDFKEWSSEWEKSPKRFYKLLAEYAVCFANRRGGTLVLGVRDNVIGREKAITGCGPYNVHEIRSRIYDLTEPRILVDVEEVHVDDLGVWLLLIHMPQGVSAVHTTTDGVAKIRIGKDCKPMTGSMRVMRLVESGHLDVTANVFKNLDYQALDPLEIERLRQLIQARNPGSPLLDLRDTELVEQIGITRNGFLTGSGLLLIGRESVIREKFPHHEIEYLRMKNDTEYERRETFYCGILKAIEELYRNIELYNTITTVKVGLFYYEIKDFPEETYREAILNAVLHRDYMKFGSVFVKHYDDRLEISNPGGFIAGITPENILRQDSHPRNRNLAEVLRRIGLIEKAGVGVKRMYHTQLISGKMPPVYWTDGNSVRVTLLDGTIDESFVQWVRKQEKTGKVLSLDELLLISSLRRKRELFLTEAISILQLNRKRAQEILLQMVKKGLLERSGIRKGQIYRLSSSVYKALGESIAYVRERGIDAIRHEELVLEFVRQYGSITNRQVRELLGIDIHAAKRLLNKLLNAGKLQRKGKRRGAHYVLPN